MKKARLPLVGFLTGFLLLVGCAASGPKFAPLDSIPEGKALVYIYRPNSIIGGAIRFHVAVGGERIVYLIRGGYYPYFADPGETTFWARTEAKAETTEYLEAGETYYLKGGVGIGLMVGRPRLSFEDADAGAKAVKKCVLLLQASN